jgi:hypothetical protein
MKSAAARVKLDWSKLLAFSQIKSIPANGEAAAPGNPVKAMVGGKGNTSPGAVLYLPFYLMMESNRRKLGGRFAGIAG